MKRKLKEEILIVGGRFAGTPEGVDVDCNIILITLPDCPPSAELKGPFEEVLDEALTANSKGKTLLFKKRHSPQTSVNCCKTCLSCTEQI